MKTLMESIIGRRGFNPNKIVPRLERALNDNAGVEELAEKHNVSFEAMRDLFNKVKETVRQAGDMNIGDRERAEWIDDFLENSADELLDDPDLDRITREVNRNKDTLKDIVDDVADWMFMQIR